MLIRATVLQITRQQVEATGLTTICWNNIGLEVRHNVSSVTMLSRCTAKWMTRQNVWGVKKGGYHKVTDRVTSPVHFQRDSFKKQPVFEGDNASMMEKHQGAWTAKSTYDGAKFGDLLGSSFCSLFFAVQKGLKVTISGTAPTDTSALDLYFSLGDNKQFEIH